MINYRVKIFTTIICGLISISAFAQKTYVLRQNYPTGYRYDFSITSDQIINQKIGGQDVHLTQNIGTDYTFDITEGHSGEKDVKVTYNKIFMKSVGMGNTMIFNSDDQDSTKKNPFSGLKGASFYMIVTPNGAIKSVAGIDIMLNKMAAKMTTDTSQVKQIKDALSKQFSAEVVKQTMESSFKIYPDRAVKIGDSWTVDTKMQMSMPIETITQYTLKEVKDGIAVLSVKGTLVSKGNFEAMGNKMETDLKGTNSGETSLDIKTGIVLNSHLRVELYGKMKSMGQDIDFEMQGINKIVGKEIK
jgi:predicted secreted protein